MLHHGDCLSVLRTFQNDQIDALVTDPPAGIFFMGKEWDKGDNFIPSMTEVFKECLRVMKPGAHGLVWALPRTSHWTATALEQAGFEIRDVVTHLFGSGFPKSHNLGNGWGTALKPASEHWILVRKKCSEKTVAANVLKYGTGGINIDASRIGIAVSDPHLRHNTVINKDDGDVFMGNLRIGEGPNHGPTHQGRFPANLVLDEEAAAMLDEQSGDLGKSAGGNSKNVGNKVYGKYEDDLDRKPCGFGDKGGASRFFYVAKASKKDRNEGLEGLPLVEKKTLNDYTSPSEGRTADKNGSPQQNFHPTVKSTKLMEYLITLVTPPNGTVLDPFMGSGSTGKAAKRLGFKFIGIEKNEEYFNISQKRIV
jgi:DNA modification methylase